MKERVSLLLEPVKDRYVTTYVLQLPGVSDKPFETPLFAFFPQGYEANCFPLLADALRLRAHFRRKLASEEGSFWGQLVALSQDEVAGRRWGGMTPSLAMIFCIYARNPGEKGLTRANHPLPHKAW